VLRVSTDHGHVLIRVVSGLNPVILVTHSLRKGSVSDQFTNGVPEKIIKYSGQWRSNAFESYIDHTVLFEPLTIYLNITEEETEEDVKIDMVDIISQTYGENHPREKLWIMCSWED
jgi:hypothetical protein